MKWFLPFAVCLLLVGCGTTQSAQVDPKSTIVTKADLDKITAAQVVLDQRTQSTLNTVNTMKQDADTFRTEVKGNIASLTQFQLYTDRQLVALSRSWLVRHLWTANYVSFFDSGSLAGVGEAGKYSLVGNALPVSPANSTLLGGSGAISGSPIHPAKGDDSSNVRHWYSWPSWW